MIPGETSPPDRNRGPRTRTWSNGTVADDHTALCTVSELLLDPDAVLWIDLVDPTRDELRSLAKQLSVDVELVDNAMALLQRAKAARYPGYTFVVAYSTILDDAVVRMPRLSAFVLDRVLITVHGVDWEGIDDLTARWDELDDLIAAHGVNALLCVLLDTLVAEQFATAQAIDAEIERLDDAVVGGRDVERTDPRRQFELRRSLVALRRVSTPMAQMIRALHRAFGGDDPGMRSYWADLEDHVALVIDWIDSARDLVDNVYAATMSRQDARRNDVMKKLTAWAAIIAVPTAITGFYGQNVNFPQFGTTAGFVVSSVLSIATMVVLYIQFRRSDWL